MADYNPPRENVPIFNNNEFRPVTGGGGLTEAEADLLYLKFPVAQGPETLGIITVTDTATFNGLVEVNQTLDASNIETVNLDVELDATINNLDNTNLDTSYGIVNKVVSNEIIGIGNIISTYPNIRTVWYVQDYDPGTGDPTTPAVIASEIDTTLYRVRGLKFSATGSLVSTSNWFTYTPQVNIDKYFGFIINPGLPTADIPILTNWDPITGLSTSTFYVPVGGAWDNTQYQDLTPFNNYEQYLTAETATRRFIVSPPNDDTLSITSKGGSITMGTYNNLPQASTVSSGIVQLTDSYVSPSLTEAPTANALADAYIDLDNKITINRKDIDSLERVTQIQVPQSFDYSIGSGGDFADLQTALASSLVKNGTILRIIAGTTINILTTLTITKQVTIYGDNRDTCIIRNDPTVTNMVTLLSCQADYVTFNNLTINFTSSITDNFALIFTSASGGNVKNPIVANCRVVYNKFGIVERGENFIVDNVLFQTQGTASTRRAVTIYRSAGNCFVSNCVFNQTIDTNNRLIHILETSINDTKVGTHNFINNRSTGLCFQFINYESFRGITDGLSIIVRGNTMNESSAFLVLFNSTLNAGNTVKDVFIQNNTFTNRHTSTPPNGGKGCLALDTSVVFKSVSLPVYSFNNVATVDQTFRSGWVLAQNSTGVNVGITTAGNTAYTTAGFNPVAFNDVEVSVLALPPVPSEFNSDDNRLRILETNASGGGSFLPLSGGQLTGNLGILKAPTVPLDVLGNATITGTLTATTYSNLPTASTSGAGIVQLNDTVSSTSTTQAGTANSVKTAYDTAVSANTNANNRVLKTGDTMTGSLTVPTITSIASTSTNSLSTVLTSSEQLVGQQDIYHNDILPIGSLATGPFSGLVNSVIPVQAYDINGYPTNTWGFICLEYQNLTTKNVVRGALYNTDGILQSATPWYPITTGNSLDGVFFDQYYGRFNLNNGINPYFTLDFNALNLETRILIFINEFGTFTWDTPYPQSGTPIDSLAINENQYVNNPNLNKRALGNKYTNSLSFHNKDATIVTDSISASTYNDLPSLPFLPLSGGSLSGALDGTTCEMLTYLGADYQVKSPAGQPYLAGVTSDFTTGVMNVYANDNINGAINQVIKNVTVGQWNDGGLKLLSNDGNTTLRLESGANQQSSIHFGDSTTNNRGRIHYQNNTNTMDFHVNNSNTPTISLSNNGTIINGDTTIRNTGGSVTQNIQAGGVAGIACIEMGGALGGFIDIKRPFSDDWDLRLSALDNSGGAINVAGNAPLSIFTNNSERMKIQGNGNIALGGVATADSLLGANNTYKFAQWNNGNVQGRLQGIYNENGFPNFSSDTYITANFNPFDNVLDNNLYTASALRISTGQTIEQNAFEFKTSSSIPSLPSTKMVIKPNGNVGIGTTNPITTLNVIGDILAGNSGNNSVYVGGRTNESENGARLHYSATECYLDTRGNALNFRIDNQQAGTIAMRLLNNGNLGIGTTNPQSRLDVVRSGQSNDFTARFVESTSGKYIGFVPWSVGDGSYMTCVQSGDTIITALPNNASPLSIGAGGSTGGCLRFTNTTNEVQIPTSKLVVGGISPGVAVRNFEVRPSMRIKSTDNTNLATLDLQNANNSVSQITQQANGSLSIYPSNIYLGINRVPGTFELDLSTDSARKLTTNTWATGSDERVKENIEVADYNLCYENVKQLDLKRFKWNEQKYPKVDDRNVLGFIAQDVEPIYPNAVKTGYEELPDGSVIEDFKTLQVDQIYKMMYGALRKSIEKVETLETIIQQQNQRISNLETLLLNVVQRFNALDDNDEDIIV